MNNSLCPSKQIRRTDSERGPGEPRGRHFSRLGRPLGCYHMAAEGDNQLGLVWAMPLLHLKAPSRHPVLLHSAEDNQRLSDGRRHNMKRKAARLGTGISWQREEGHQEEGGDPSRSPLRLQPSRMLPLPALRPFTESRAGPALRCHSIQSCHLTEV